MNYTASIITLLFCSVTSYSIIRWASFINLSKTNTTGERFASQSKPIFGGFIFLIGIVSSIFTDYVFPSTNDHSLQFLIPILIAFSAGLLDDVKNTPPGFKFITQIFTGIAIYYAGLCPSFFINEYANLALCIVWSVTLMNSLNMLDNMDAITSSTSLTIIASLIFASLILPLNVETLTLPISIAISIFIFLLFNWHPSRMYMGDNGSQLIGAVIAILTLQAFAPHTISDSFEIRPIISLIISLSVPLSDTASVSINRILAGKSPFVGDRNHTTHNLFYLGISIPKIALVFISLTLITNAIAYTIAFKLIDSILFESGLVIISALICIGLYATTVIPKKDL